MLVELGAGTCEKSRVLLDAMLSNGSLQEFVPLDVSDSTLWEAATALARAYPGLAVHAVVGDFHRHLDRLPAGGRRLIAFLGGTIGNLDPEQRRRSYDRARLRSWRPTTACCSAPTWSRTAPGWSAPTTTPQGVTAEFNRNVLHVLNRELGADFDPRRFEHVARWNEEDSRIEMWLRSSTDQTVHVADLDLDLSFERRRGDAHRDQHQVLARRAGGGAGRGRASPSSRCGRRPGRSSCSPRLGPAERTPAHTGDSPGPSRRGSSASEEVLHRVLDGPVERRVGVDHVAQAIGRHLGVDGQRQQPEHLAAGRTGRRRPDEHAPCRVLDELDEAAVVDLVDEAPGR